MLADFNSLNDITVFIDEEEIKQLGLQTLEGTIIRRYMPRSTSKVFLSVDDAKTINSEGKRDIVVENAADYNITISSYYYVKLAESERIEDSYGIVGNKVKLVREVYANVGEQNMLEQLQSCLNNSSFF